MSVNFVKPKSIDQGLPLEIHLTLAEFMGPSELLALSQTCTSLRDAYRPMAWKHCEVDKLFRDSRETDRLPGSHLNKFVNVPLRVVTQPDSYGWFPSQFVKEILFHHGDGNGINHSIHCNAIVKSLDKFSRLNKIILQHWNRCKSPFGVKIDPAFSLRNIDVECSLFLNSPSFCFAEPVMPSSELVRSLEILNFVDGNYLQYSRGISIPAMPNLERLVIEASVLERIYRPLLEMISDCRSLKQLKLIFDREIGYSGNIAQIISQISTLPFELEDCEIMVTKKSLLFDNNFITNDVVIQDNQVTSITSTKGSRKFFKRFCYTRLRSLVASDYLTSNFYCPEVTRTLTNLTLDLALHGKARQQIWLLSSFLKFQSLEKLKLTIKENRISHGYGYFRNASLLQGDNPRSMGSEYFNIRNEFARGNSQLNFRLAEKYDALFRIMNPLKCFDYIAGQLQAGSAEVMLLQSFFFEALFFMIPRAPRVKYLECDFEMDCFFSCLALQTLIHHRPGSIQQFLIRIRSKMDKKFNSIYEVAGASCWAGYAKYFWSRYTGLFPQKNCIARSSIPVSKNNCLHSFLYDFVRPQFHQSLDMQLGLTENVDIMDDSFKGWNSI